MKKWEYAQTMGLCEEAIDDWQEEQWAVWVGGIEVTDQYPTTYGEAQTIAFMWRAKGYDDVQVERIEP